MFGSGKYFTKLESHQIEPTRSFIYENDQRKKIGTLGDFDNKTPTHMAATHAISKYKLDF